MIIYISSAVMAGFGLVLMFFAFGERSPKREAVTAAIWGMVLLSLSGALFDAAWSRGLP